MQIKHTKEKHHPIYIHLVVIGGLDILVSLPLRRSRLEGSFVSFHKPLYFTSKTKVKDKEVTALMGGGWAYLTFRTHILGERGGIAGSQVSVLRMTHLYHCHPETLCLISFPAQLSGGGSQDPEVTAAKWWHPEISHGRAVDVVAAAPEEGLRHLVRLWWPGPKSDCRWTSLCGSLVSDREAAWWAIYWVPWCHQQMWAVVGQKMSWPVVRVVRCPQRFS